MIRYVNKAEMRDFVFAFLAIFVSFSVFMNDIITSDYIPGSASMGNIKIPSFRDVISGARYMNILIIYIYKLLFKLGVSHYRNTWVIQLLGMLLYAISAQVMLNMFSAFIDKANKRTSLLLRLSVLFAFINPFMIETYMYGAFDWGIGICLVVLGSYCLCKDRIILAMFFGFLGVSTYQSNVYIMMIISVYYVFFCYLTAKLDTRKFIIQEIKYIFISMSIAVINVIIQKIGVLIIDAISEDNRKMTPIKNVDVSQMGLNKIVECYQSMKAVFRNLYGMISYSKLALLLFAILLNIFIILVSYKTKKSSLFFSFTCVNILAMMAPFSFGLVTWVSYPQRTMLSLFFVLCFMCIFFIIASEILEDSVKTARKTVLLFLISLFVFVYCNTQVCITDAYASQALDKYEAKLIGRLIKDYEKENNCEISIVATCGGGDGKIGGTYVHEELLKEYDYTYPYAKITYPTWSQAGYLNYINGTCYDMRAMTDEEIDTIFKDVKSKGYFEPNEQMVFRGNTLYWMIY